MAKPKDLPLLEDLLIVDMADKGRGLARHEGKVVFVAGAVPGDRATVQVHKSKSSFAEGRAVAITTPSPDRREPFCRHFGLCGGCKWQHLDYAAQARFKQQHVEEALRRIGHLELPPITPILASPTDRFYRNKLEYTFSNQRWFEGSDRDNPDAERRGLGFHIPGRFDKVVDVRECFHQPGPSNRLRDAFRQAMLDLDLSCRDLRDQVGEETGGWLRNLIIRNTLLDEWMVIVQITHENDDALKALFDGVIPQFPEVTSWQYVVNGKGNDTFHDLDVRVWAGRDHIIEGMEDLRFRIGPKSFFQTNALQAQELYRITRRMAGLTGQERVYDLYTGTGTIALFVAKQAREVIGVEYVAAAVEDAKVNAALNGVTHAKFFAGDMAKVLTADFIAAHGRPDVVITDPPRGGMDEAVVLRLKEASPQRIVYVSCNPATQARDLALLDDLYRITEVQPVDMFPQTDHVESVVRLELRHP